jgi:hypothetical protein
MSRIHDILEQLECCLQQVHKMTTNILLASQSANFGVPVHSSYT